MRGPPERWPSGLRRTLGKRVCGKPYRGFESHSLRQPNFGRWSSPAKLAENFAVSASVFALENVIGTGQLSESRPENVFFSGTFVLSGRSTAPNLPAVVAGRSF